MHGGATDIGAVDESTCGKTTVVRDARSGRPWCGTHAVADPPAQCPGFGPAASRPVVRGPRTRKREVWISPLLWVIPVRPVRTDAP